MSDLSLTDQLFHRPGSLLNGDIPVDPVNIVQVQMICTETFQRPFHRPFDGLRPAVRDQGYIYLSGILIKPYPALGRQDDPVPVRFQRLAQQFLVVMRIFGGAVDLRCVKKGIAFIHSFGEQLRHFLSVSRRTIRMAHAHASQPDGGHLQIFP